MRYYKVKPKYDNVRIIRRKNGKKVFCGEILIGDELYTPAERKRLPVPDYCFDEVEISQRKTHWFFGARYEDGREVVCV